jgi:hypothetical protein
LPELHCCLHIALSLSMPANPTGEVAKKRLHIPLLKDSGSLGGLISRNGSRRGMLRVTTLNGIKKCPALFAERLTCALPNGSPLSLSAAKISNNPETCKKFGKNLILDVHFSIIEETFALISASMQPTQWQN